MTTFTNFASADDFIIIIIIFPGNVNLLYRPCFNIFSLVVLCQHTSKTSAVKVSPNIRKGP